MAHQPLAENPRPAVYPDNFSPNPLSWRADFRPEADAPLAQNRRPTDYPNAPLELKVGFEPTTCGLRNRCSTAELLQHTYLVGIRTALLYEATLLTDS